MRKFLKIYILIIVIFFLTDCGSTSKDKNEAKIDTTTSSIKNIANDSIVVDDSSENNYETYFVVVADTSVDYSTLHQKMFYLSKQLNTPIDTMGRLYNKTKNLIALPVNDKDEIYAGEYFPRRFPAENLSLEYLNFYQSSAGEKTIALVTGIYEAEKSADSALIVLGKTEKNAFKIKANIYVGCMH